VLLLVALGAVLAALFLSGRLLLSLANDQPLAQHHAIGPCTTPTFADLLLLHDDRTEQFGAVAKVVAISEIVLG
jgi:hypothetical protein